MLVLLLATSFALSHARTSIVGAGYNATLQSAYMPDSDQIPHITWYLQTSKPNSSFYEGNKLCDDSDNRTHTFPHPSLQFECVNKSLKLYNLKPSDSGLYHAVVEKSNLEVHSDYIELTVVDLPPPKCEVSSSYLEVQGVDAYCLIHINCSNSKYPARIYYNGQESNLFYYLTTSAGNGKQLPDYFTAVVEFSTYRETYAKRPYNFSYPFNDLCNEIQALETGTDFTPIFIAAIVVSLITIIVSLAFYCFYKPKNPKFEKLKLKPVIQQV
ncbi:E3 CR1-beta1 [simian adenovirus 1]|uniref:E3 CR1-beta1 n=1 Tax=simian adenovirus 1 TaxID=310540 RepID=Q5C8P0_9ADEN|nr:E3 CR1-beta1 [Simian adenovirus 1]AAX19417.1 E3 CR1-beta1 [Simian adenovirus 1]